MQISVEALIQNACISPGAHKHQSHQSHVCNVVGDQSVTACVPPLPHLSLTPSQLLRAPWPLSYPFVAFICGLEWPVFVAHVESQTILLQAGFNSLPLPHTTVGRDGESVCGLHSCGCPRDLTPSLDLRNRSGKTRQTPAASWVGNFQSLAC